MAREVLDAVEKLLQFSSHTNPDAPISRKDLQPVFAAVATALSDIDRRLQESNTMASGATQTAKAAMKAIPQPKPTVARR